MSKEISIIGSDQVDGEAVIVDLSDGTSLSITLEQLLALRNGFEPVPEEPGEES